MSHQRENTIALLQDFTKRLKNTTLNLGHKLWNNSGNLLYTPFPCIIIIIVINVHCRTVVQNSVY